MQIQSIHYADGGAGNAALLGGQGADSHQLETANGRKDLLVTRTGENQNSVTVQDYKGGGQLGACKAQIKRYQTNSFLRSHYGVWRPKRLEKANEKRLQNQGVMHRDSSMNCSGFESRLSPVSVKTGSKDHAAHAGMSYGACA